MPDDVVVDEPVRAPAAEPWFVTDLRRMAAAGCAGLVTGFVVNAVGGRLAMMLLARLNPAATGLISDDGFRIGQFDLAATLNLTLFATALGVLGGLVYLVVRPLRVGPGWFQKAALTIGAAVVVGAAIVHTGGVDFVFLEPVALAIALFVALPGVFALAVVWLADRWLSPGSWFLGGSPRRLTALLPLVLTAPALPLVAAGALGRGVYKSVPALQQPGARRALRVVGRLLLAGVFAAAAVNLSRDVAALL